MRIGLDRVNLLGRPLRRTEPVLPPSRGALRVEVTSQPRVLGRNLASILLFSLWVLGGEVFAVDSIVVSFDRERAYFPGDLIELEVSVLSNEYGRFVLREPRHGSVRNLETQAFPVRKQQDGQYKQRWVVLYQIGRSGDILLQGGVLEKESDLESDPIAIEPVSLVAEGFGAAEDSNAPETLVDKSDAKGRSRWIYFIVALAGIVVGAFAWWKKNKKVDRVEREQSSPLQEAVRSLLANLEKGQTPVGDLELFLLNYKSDCSPSLRDAIEQTVYSKIGQPIELKDRLRKEFSI